MRLTIDTTVPMSGLDFEMLGSLVSRHVDDAGRQMYALVALNRDDEPETVSGPVVDEPVAVRPEDVVAETEPERAPSTEPNEAPDMDEVMARTKELVESGREAEVRRALKAVGVKKVSAMSDDPDVRIAYLAELNN